MSFNPRPMRRLLAIGAVAVLGAGALASCSGGQESSTGEDCVPAHPDLETVEPGKLTVSAYDFAPFSIIEGDEMSGVEGELLQQVADMECLELVVQSSGGANAAIPSVETGRVDIATTCWYRTAARSEIVRLSAPVYLDEPGVASKDGIVVDDFEGKVIASVAGNFWNESMQKWLGDDFKVYQDEESIFSDLEADRIDGVLASIPAMQRTLDSKGIEAVIEPLTPHPNVPEFEKPGQVNWPTSYDNEALGEALDENIATLHEEGKVLEVLKKYEVPETAADVGEPYEL